MTFLYRVHLIITAKGFMNPRSYRTEEWASSFETAWGAAVKSLNDYAATEGWTDLQVLTYGSCERVPGTELSGIAAAVVALGEPKQKAAPESGQTPGPPVENR